MKPVCNLAVLSAVVLAACAVMMSGCTKHDEEEAEPKPVAFVETAKVERRDVAETITAYGTVEPAPEDALPVGVDRDSSVARVLVKAGVAVKAGDALVEVVESKAAALDAQRARIDVTFAEREVERLRALRDKGLTTNAEVQAAEAALEKAKAEAASFGAPSGRHTVRAPSAGMVRTVIVKPGDAVAAGGPVVLLATGHAKQVRLGVEPAEIDRFAVGAAVHLRLVDAPAIDDGGAKGSGVDATVLQVHRQVDADTHMAAVTVAFSDEHDALLQGALCRGDVVVREEKGALAVPHKSLVVDKEGAAVFIVQSNKAVRRPLEVLIDDGDVAAVKGALAEGDVVVTVGAAELEDKMEIRTGPPKASDDDKKGAGDDDKKGAGDDDKKGAGDSGEKAKP